MSRYAPRTDYLTGAPRDALVGQWGQPSSLFKLIQVGSIDLNNVTSATATITGVVLANAILIPNGHNTSATSHDQAFARLTFTNATTITATRYLLLAAAEPVKFTVVEFNPNFYKSIQHGTVDLNAGSSATATITSVATAKAYVIHLGQTNNSTGSLANTLTTVVLTNATTVTCAANTAPAGAAITGFTVVEGR